MDSGITGDDLQEKKDNALNDLLERKVVDKLEGFEDHIDKIKGKSKKDIYKPLKK